MSAGQVEAKPRRRRRLLTILVAGAALLVMAFFVGKHFLWDISPVPEEPELLLSMEEVRSLARSRGDDLPVELRTLRVAEGSIPAGAAVAGAGWKWRELDFRGFQVVYPDRTVIIDAVHDRATHQRFYRGQPYDDAAWRLQQRALREASLIIVTHEHFDHLGGVSASPYLSQIHHRLLLTDEQVSAKIRGGVVLPAAILRDLVPLRYERLHLAAPGIVLIKTPGHTPGHQWVYVELRDGRQFLLCGDTGWVAANARIPRGRPRLVSMMIGEDRDELSAQLRRLHGGRGLEGTRLVFSHDPDHMARWIQEGSIAEGYVLGPGREERGR